MSSSILQDAVEGRARVVPWTVELYDDVIDHGLLPEDHTLELIDGFIVHKDRAKAGEDSMTVGDLHTYALQQLSDLMPEFKRRGCHLRIQQPVSLPPFNEPEPDGAVVVGAHHDYIGRKPVDRDVLCVMEASDSSLRLDRATKQRIYASAGIPRYIIINIPERQLESMTEPLPAEGRYARTMIYRSGQSIELPTATPDPVVIDAEHFFV